MPIQEFTLDPTGTKRVQIFQESSSGEGEILILVNNAIVGSISHRDELRAGKQLTLKDGSLLFIRQTNEGYQVLYDNQPLRLLSPADIEAVQNPSLRPGLLARPLPAKVRLVFCVLTIAVLVALLFTGSNWAYGAANSATGALIIIIALLIALLVRTRAGMASPLNPIRVRQYTFSILCIVALVSDFVVLQVAQPILHRAQAQSWEQQQHWQQALDEYTLSGEHAPDGQDLARVLWMWGQQQLQAKQYEGAVAHFDILLKSFPTFPEAGQLHADMAKALMGEGLNQKAQSCSTAIPTYERLAKDFSDTAEGRIARAALQQGAQDVKGHFEMTLVLPTQGLPPFYTNIGLGQGITKDISDADLRNKWDNAIQTVIDKNKDFTFHNVPPGDYDLMLYGDQGLSQVVEVPFDQGSTQPAYIVHVTALCAVDIGTVTN